LVDSEYAVKGGDGAWGALDGPAGADLGLASLARNAAARKEGGVPWKGVGLVPEDDGAAGGNVGPDWGGGWAAPGGGVSAWERGGATSTPGVDDPAWEGDGAASACESGASGRDVEVWVALLDCESLSISSDI